MLARDNGNAYYGEVLASGAPADIQANARVREVYLGMVH